MTRGGASSKIQENELRSERRAMSPGREHFFQLQRAGRDSIYVSHLQIPPNQFGLGDISQGLEPDDGDNIPIISVYYTCIKLLTAASGRVAFWQYTYQIHRNVMSSTFAVILSGLMPSAHQPAVNHSMWWGCHV